MVREVAPTIYRYIDIYTTRLQNAWATNTGHFVCIKFKMAASRPGYRASVFFVSQGSGGKFSPSPRHNAQHANQNINQKVGDVTRGRTFATATAALWCTAAATVAAFAEPRAAAAREGKTERRKYMTRRGMLRQDLTEKFKPQRKSSKSSDSHTCSRHRKPTRTQTCCHGNKTHDITKETINNKTKHRSGAINTRN